MNELAAILLSGALFAQSPASETTPEAETEVAQPTAQDQLIEVQGRLTSLEEQYAETKTDVLSLKNLKFSGYVQPRFHYSEASKDGLDAKGNPQVKDGFSVRRGRLKATYSLPYSQLVLQIDATPKGLSLKDAEAHLIEPWTGKKLTLVLGQHKWPFGYEVVQSSGDREFPERTRVVRAFAPGERDRGAKLMGSVKFLRFAAGIFDGNGTENKSAISRASSSAFIGVDNDRHKDVVGRVGVAFDWIALGVSGWYGQTRQPADPDVDPPLTRKDFPRTRVGADLQLYLDLLPFGATALKAEGMLGETWMKDGVEQFGKKAMGGYALLVQNIGLNNAVAVRYDYFDGNSEEETAADSNDPTKPASANAVSTIGAAFIHHWDEALKLSLVYEVPVTEVPASVDEPKDSLFTIQLQAKF